jgi:hypothetical protein
MRTVESNTNNANLKGHARVRSNASTHGLNPLEVLHVMLGHISEKYIKHLIRNNLVNGAGYTYADIKDLSLPLCKTCILAKSKRQPVPASVSNVVYGPLEYICSDIVGPITPQSRHYYLINCCKGT